MLLGIYPEMLKKCPGKNLNIGIYSSLIIAKMEAMCLSVGECISKLWYVQGMDCYSELKRNEL